MAAGAGPARPGRTLPAGRAGPATRTPGCARSATTCGSSSRWSSLIVVGGFAIGIIGLLLGFSGGRLTVATTAVRARSRSVAPGSRPTRPSDGVAPADWERAHAELVEHLRDADPDPERQPAPGRRRRRAPRRPSGGGRPRRRRGAARDPRADPGSGLGRPPGCAATAPAASRSSSSPTSTSSRRPPRRLDPRPVRGRHRRRLRLGPRRGRHEGDGRDGGRRHPPARRRGPRGRPRPRHGSDPRPDPRRPVRRDRRRGGRRARTAPAGSSTTARAAPGRGGRSTSAAASRSTFGGRRFYPIGVAEKGYANYRITVHGTWGHGSMPRADNAAVRAAAIVDPPGRARPDPARPRRWPASSTSVADELGGPTGELVRRIASPDGARERGRDRRGLRRDVRASGPRPPPRHGLARTSSTPG